MSKKIVLGITGGIAAYKCAELVRRLREQNCEVKVVMTQSAEAFITPLTMQAVSGNPVSTSLLDPAAEAAMGHIEFAKWADLILVAPASANTLAKMAQGLADDLLSTLLLATPAKVAVAPAMNQQMYAHPATQANLALLAERGVAIWGPAQGEQACGDIGPGRMLEPHQLVELCTKPEIAPLLHGKTITITAGPTQEALDPVRFISNHSSGKMGFALAHAATLLGAKVNLIAGPVNLATPANCERFNVVSAQNMLEQALTLAPQSDVFIGCAAVADYRAAEIANNKMKKQGDEMVIKLAKNPDIIASVAALTTNRPFTVGFAAETNDVANYAKDKLARKNLDLICANDVSQAGIGFNSDNNAMTLFWPEGERKLSLNSKQNIAIEILSQISELLN